MTSFQHRCRHYAGRVRDILRESGPAGLLEKVLDSLGERLIPGAYRYWIFRYDRLGPQRRRALTAEIASLTVRPSISVLLTTGQADLPRLAAAVHSVERPRAERRPARVPDALAHIRRSDAARPALPAPSVFPTVQHARQVAHTVGAISSDRRALAAERPGEDFRHEGEGKLRGLEPSRIGKIRQA